MSASAVLLTAALAAQSSSAANGPNSHATKAKPKTTSTAPAPASGKSRRPAGKKARASAATERTTSSSSVSTSSATQPATATTTPTPSSSAGTTSGSTTGITRSGRAQFLSSAARSRSAPATTLRDTRRQTAARRAERRSAAAARRRARARARGTGGLFGPGTLLSVPRLGPPIGAASGGASAGVDKPQPPRQVKGTGTTSKEPAESPVIQTVKEIVEVVPGPLKVALVGLAVLSALLLCGYLFATLRSRRLARQRGELLQEMGLLQAALLPPVPERIGGVRASVAYRPAEGPAAGGDFYDALALPGGRAGFILGDVSGHGRDALAHTAFMRYTLRAYLEAGLEPRAVLQIAERVVGSQLGGDFATGIVAVHDPNRGTLTYASAGHPAPIVVGETGHDPIPAASSPPIGWGLSTGQRQTTVPLASGTRALLYTDGLEEARTPEGEILGRERLTEIVVDCGPESNATDILDRVAAEAGATPDDMAACVVAPVHDVRSAATRTEQLELTGDEREAEILTSFLDGCGVAPLEAERARAQAGNRVRLDGGALVTVDLAGESPKVEVLPRNVESLEVASRRRSGLTSVGP